METITPKISVLIPAYNAEAYIDECLASVREQTLADIEIIVADDGSTDNTLQRVEAHAAVDGRIRLLRLSHRGVSPTRNALLAAAEGTYVGFVDSDDTVAPDAFEQLYRRAEACRADMVIGSVLYCRADGSSYRMGERSKTFPAPSEVLSGKECFCRLMENDEYVPMVCGSLFRRRLVTEHGLHFECATHDDEFFTPYAFYAAGRVAYCPGDFYFYRLHNASLVHAQGHLRERVAALCFIAGKLKSFIDGQLADEEVKNAYDSLVADLRRRAQQAYEQALAASTRPCLFIVSGESMANQYGVGTYISQLTRCFDPSAWDILILTLYARQQQVVAWKYEDGIASYGIPTPPALQGGWSENNEKQYYRNVFYFMASRIPSERAVYCHFNFTSHYELAKLFREKLRAKVLFTLHYTEWGLHLLGDRRKMEQIVAGPETAWEKQVAGRFESERKFMLDCCDKVIAIAHHSYDMLRDMYGIPREKIAYIPNGMRDDYVERTAEEREALRVRDRLRVERAGFARGGRGHGERPLRILGGKPVPRLAGAPHGRGIRQHGQPGAGRGRFETKSFGGGRGLRKGLGGRGEREPAQHKLCLADVGRLAGLGFFRVDCGHGEAGRLLGAAGHPHDEAGGGRLGIHPSPVHGAWVPVGARVRGGGRLPAGRRGVRVVAL